MKILKVRMQSNEFELGAYLPYQLAVLSERVSKRLAVYYETEFGLTTAEWRVLVHLSRCDVVSVREIHNCVNLEKSRVSRAVSKLDARKLVQKSESERDHRLVAISLSKRGLVVLAQITKFALEYEQTLTSALAQSDRQSLKHIMEVLHQVLDGDPKARPRSILDTLPD